MSESEKGNIFDLHRQVLDDYRDFVHSFIQIADERARDFVEQALLYEDRLWPEPLLQISPSYRKVADVDELAKKGLIHPETARIFRTPEGRPFLLYQHQLEAIEKAACGQSFVVTSGTGSGKSFCYFIPIVDALMRQATPARPAALIVYPMNALANSQLYALEQLAQGYTRRTGKKFPLRFARYTGETSEEERAALRDDPPHIVLTNYMMAELMLVRPEDRGLLAGEDSRRFLVFDELHTYRGRQGADVAMLVRRLKARLGGEIVHIGTSATMVAHRGASLGEAAKAVADFATKFFGHLFTPNEVIAESLEPITSGGPPSEEELMSAWGMPLPDEAEAFCRHPLVRWTEYALGIEEREGRLCRRVPRPLSQAAEELARICGQSEEAAQAKLKAVLLSALQRPSVRFPFKLHQFIGQGQAVYATLEPAAQRRFSLETVQEDQALWVPVRFCRICGQDHYLVVRIDGQVRPGPVGLEPSEGEVGYLTLEFEELDLEAVLPADWYDRFGRISPTWKRRIPKRVWVFADGRIVKKEEEGATPMWWQAERFWLCLRCGEYYTGREGEYAKLTGLSSEGRSSATTVLAVALLRHAEKTGALRGKLLTFTDNRQDASLQAGHFNDFIQVALVRAALYRALYDLKELRFDNLAHEVVSRMRLSVSDFAKNPALDPQSSAAREVQATFEDLMEYRLYEDLRRGWRLVQPNLEEVGLLKIEYAGLEALGEDSLADLPELLALSGEERQKLLKAVLDVFRKRLAIETRVLSEEFQKRLRRRGEQYLNDFWGVDPDSSLLRQAAILIRPGSSARLPRHAVRLTARSALGRYLKRVLNLDEAGTENLLDRLLPLLVRQGWVRKIELEDHVGFRLDAACLRWRLGDGVPPLPDPVLSRRRTDRPIPVNRFFQRFYQEAAQEIGQLEAREHTAQVVAPGERQRREKRFRGEEAPPLPYLVCSPTLELGIDIADLDMVHLRNVPPTPANYAQRSGRAGRQGQPGLIVAYCGAYSPHDRYFFHHREEMVAGNVRAPRLDLNNPALVRAHVQAEWLAQVGLPLRQSVQEVLDLDQADTLPIQAALRPQLHLSQANLTALQERLEAIFASYQEPESSSFRSQLKQILVEAPHAFDRAFDRWRELYRAACAQLNKAHVLTLQRDRESQEIGRRLIEEANHQRRLLLQQEVAREESDFYPYRYLASEGFLPGYNFPALPVRAWVPRRGQGEFIARPRFLAIREFGPHNLVYHEGATWEVVRFQAPPGGLSQRRLRRKICQKCCAFTEANDDVCPVCGVVFDATTSQIVELLSMPNVVLRRRERITCNEEERVRRGYRLEVAYRPAHAHPVTEASVPGCLTLSYLPAASLLSVNHGWRAKTTEGFLIDPDSGELLSEDQNAAGHSTPCERIKLCVEDTQNLLRIKLSDPGLRQDRVFEASLMQALKRAIEQLFQLEETELVGLAAGQEEERAILLYEAAEGGAGVLKRLVEEPSALAEVAEEALRLLHFDPKTGQNLKDSHLACYECLLSFANQLEAPVLNRFKVLSFLQTLAGLQVEQTHGSLNRKEHYLSLRRRVDPHSALEQRFLDHLYREGHRLPDSAQRKIPKPECVVDFFYEPNVCVFCDGAVHDAPEQRALDQAIRRQLVSLGYRVIVIRHNQDLKEQICQYPEVF